MANETDILDSIHGQRVVIPDLESLLSDWPEGRSIQEARLKHDVTDHITRFVSIAHSPQDITLTPMWYSGLRTPS
jgi:hypothetical protein